MCVCVHARVFVCVCVCVFMRLLSGIWSNEINVNISILSVNVFKDHYLTTIIGYCKICLSLVFIANVNYNLKT